MLKVVMSSSTNKYKYCCSLGYCYSQNSAPIFLFFLLRTCPFFKHNSQCLFFLKFCQQNWSRPTRLPFALQLAPKIFTALADALEWCFWRQGVKHVTHYLDDYITMGEPGSIKCAANMATIMNTRMLGAPIGPGKCEGPSTCITYLGIELDTQSIEMRLPAEKLK